MKIYGGIEGGATKSEALLVDENGTILAHSEGAYLNLFLLGLEESYSRIAELLNKAFDQLPSAERRLEALGLDLSGAHGGRIVEEFLSLLQRKHDILIPKHVELVSDALAPIYTCFGDKGGICAIAGTGTSCCLLNPDGSVHFRGGWGHLIGDQSSGYWIATTVLTETYAVLDQTHDEWKTLRIEAEQVMDLALKSFEIPDRHGILPHLYTNFEKSKIARFAKTLANEASHLKMVQNVFHDAGYWMGKHIWAVLNDADSTLCKDGVVEVVVVGSVWKSFSLLRQGFLKGLKRPHDKFEIRRIRLMQLEQSAALGAAFMASKKTDHSIHIDNENIRSILIDEQL